MVVAPQFKTREARTSWMFKNFEHLFSKKTILDVGCFEAPLRDLVGPGMYAGVDFVGAPDVNLNLESVDVLPFKDGQFDTVICIEVLEHLINLHAIARDLFRVSGQKVLISLPNCWRDARVKVERGVGEIAHYGLSVQPPMDRHKWFFNTQDATAFLSKIKPDGYDLKITIVEPQRDFFTRLLRRLRYSDIAYKNRYAQTIWAEYTRKP